MAFVKLMIHAVWGTKNLQHFLTLEVKNKVIQHIKENAKTKGIFIDEIDGYREHLHCLFALNADMTLIKELQLIKGESSYWINRENITKSKFEWADEYFAVSVSESSLDKVRTYIRNQEEHHKKITFKDEYDAFIKKHKLGGHG